MYVVYAQCGAVIRHASLDLGVKQCNSPLPLTTPKRKLISTLGQTCWGHLLTFIYSDVLWLSLALSDIVSIVRCIFVEGVGETRAQRGNCPGRWENICNTCEVHSERPRPERQHWPFTTLSPSLPFPFLFFFFLVYFSHTNSPVTYVKNSVVDGLNACCS